MVISVDRPQWIPGLDTFDEDVAPSLDEILTLKTDYQQYFLGFHEKVWKADQYFFEQNAIPAPEGFDPVHVAKARAAINTAADHVDINNFDITVPEASPRAKARAERLTKFYQGAWLQVKPAVKRMGVKHAFAYGIGFFKVGWESDKWPDGPHLDEFPDDEQYKQALEDWYERRGISFPISVDNVNPRRLLWDDSRLGPKWVIETYQNVYSQQQVRHLQRRFPEWTGRTDNHGIVDWTEYWDDKWAVYVANNEVVFSEPHGYGFMPYVQILPAFGMDVDDGEPHRRYQGILDGTWDLLDEINRSVTAHAAITRQYAWPTLDFTGPDHLTEKARGEYELFTGMNKIPSGVDVKASPRLPVPPELLMNLATMETAFEEATFPNIVRGARPRGVSSGFQVSVLAGMGRLVFQPVADAMSDAIATCNSNFAKLVENKARGKVTVHARTEIHNFDQTIGPDDVRGYYENRVVLKAESPEERERQSILAMQLHQAGIISLQEAMRRSGIINPLEMQVDIVAEQLMRSPEFLAQLNALASERVNLLAQFAAATDAGPGFNNGQFQGGMPQLQRPGETFIQGNRMASQAAGQGSVFPRGLGGLDILGSLTGAAPGGAQGQPNGQVVR